MMNQAEEKNNCIRNQALTAEIKRLYPEYVEFWKTICEFETPTCDKERIDTLGAFLKEKAAELGFEIIEKEEEVAGNALCFILNPAAEKSPVCYSAHMDTVHEVGSFGEVPVHIDGTKIFGPGVADDKGGIAASMLAMHALKNIGFSERPVKVIIQSDEEVGSSISNKSTVDFMLKMAEGCCAFFNLESTGTIKGDSESNAVPAVIIRNGIMAYRFHVYGKSAHSANYAEGANAVVEAARIILELEKMNSIEGLSCNCSMLQGGTKRNKVPDYCTFTADLRYCDEQKLLSAAEYVSELVNNPHIPGCRCEIETISSRPAMCADKDKEALIERMNVLLDRYELPLLYPAMASGGSDAAYVSEANIPTIDSIGVVGGNIHSTGEWAELESLVSCAERIAIAAVEL